jgi:hypothetical protein
MNRLVTAVAVGLAFGVFASGTPETARAERWRCASTAHFTIYSTAERDSILQTARELERMAEILRMWGLGSRLAVRQKVVLLAFSDFRPQMPVIEGKRQQVAGYVLTLPYGKWIGYAEDDPRGRAVAYHEYAHTLVAEEFQKAPPCINEGLAEYLSTFRARSDRVEFGHDLPWHRYTVVSRPLFTMNELFAVGYDSPIYRGGEEQSRFYAESWALVQYLSRAAGSWPKFRQFARAIASDTPPPAAFASAYPDESWEGLEDRLRRFLGDEPEPREIPFGSPLEELSVDFREPPQAEALAQVTLWRAPNRALDSTVTAGMVREALSAEPNLPLARAARGVLLSATSGPEAGLAEMRAAAGADTHDALALSVAGLFIMHAALRGDSTRREPLLREAGDVLERSVAADSSDARALAGFVECRVRTGDVTPLVIRSLVRVAPAVPDDPDIQRMRAQVHE